MLSHIVDELATEYEEKAKICKVNTDANMVLSAKFQITSIPCLILFKNGEIVQKITGFRPKNDIKKIIDSAL
jgi:thioredoxin 1